MRLRSPARIGRARRERRSKCQNDAFFFFNDTPTTDICTLSLHDALPISPGPPNEEGYAAARSCRLNSATGSRSEEHTSELQSQFHLVCRLLLEKKKKLRRHPL